MSTIRPCNGQTNTRFVRRLQRRRSWCIRDVGFHQTLLNLSASRTVRKCHLTFALLLILLVLCAMWSPAQIKQGTTWPHTIPARTKDTGNKDLFVMVLGNVRTPLAD